MHSGQHDPVHSSAYAEPNLYTITDADTARAVANSDTYRIPIAQPHTNAA